MALSFERGTDSRKILVKKDGIILRSFDAQDNITILSTRDSGVENPNMVRFISNHETFEFDWRDVTPLAPSRDALIQTLINDFFFDSLITQRVDTLENIIFKLAIYAEITTTSGTITKPTGSTILLDQWANGVDALVSKIVGGKPDFEDSGVDVLSFDTSGNFTLSAALPSNPAALIYYISIPLKYYGNVDIEKIIEYAEFVMNLPLGVLDVSSRISLAQTDLVISDSGNIDAYGKRMLSFADGTLYDMQSPTNRVSIDFMNRILYRMWQVIGTTNNGSTNIVELKNSDELTVFKVDTNGFELDQFDDVLPSYQWLATAGGAAPDLVAYTFGGVAVSFWTFDGGTTTEQMTNSFEIIHGIDIDLLNSDAVLAEVHTHGFPTTNGSGNVLILIDLVYMPVNGTPINYAPIYIDIPIAANQIYTHKINGSEFAKPTGGFEIGDHIIVRYTRVPSADTYAGDWAFMQCALHMPFNSRGSRQRYVK